MALEKLRTIESAVILGGVSDDGLKKIDQVAHAIIENRVLNPSNDNERKSANAIATGLVRGLAKDGEWKTDTINSLIEAVNDDNRPANQEIARMRLAMIGKAVFVAMRYSGDDDLVDRLWNPDLVEEVLPASLRGLGVEVVKNLITNRDILGELKDLDDRIEDMDLDVTISRDRKAILGEIEKTYDFITALRGLSSDEKEQRKMVKAYLNSLMQNLVDSLTATGPVVEASDGADAEGSDLANLIAEVQRLKRKVNLSSVGVVGGKDGGGMGLGAAESYQALEQVNRLTGFDDSSVLNWAAQTVDWIAREQLFFAGSGWQQFGPYMEREVRTLFKQNGKKEGEILRAIEIVRTVLAPRLYEEAIMHCDGAISTFVKTLPQAGIFDNNEFNAKRRSLLLENPVIGYFHDMLFDLVESVGLSEIKMMGNSEKANIMAEHLSEKLLSNIRKNPDVSQKLGVEDNVRVIQPLARLAVSVFLVDDLPGVILWANQSRPEMVDQVKKGRKLTNERVTGDVVVYDTMLKKSLDFSHPLTGLTRPVDIYRANNVWNETILSEAETAVRMLSEEIFYTEDGLKQCSSIGLKTLDRFDGMMSYLFGGTQAEALDSFNDLDKGLDKLQKLIQNHPDMPDLGGVVAAKLIKAKVMALMAENRTGFSSNVLRALAIERTSVPKELGDALGRMSGSGMDSSFGSIKEAVSRLGFNFIGVTDLNQAIEMLVTESDDPKKAHANLNKKKAAMFLKAILDLSGEVRGTVKRK